MKLDYIGKELENFSVASFWRKYVMSHFKTYYKNKNVRDLIGNYNSYCKKTNCVDERIQKNIFDFYITP